MYRVIYQNVFGRIIRNMESTSLSKRPRLKMMTMEDYSVDKLQILYIDDHFIAIDKPYDIRMNGEYALTVEKLMLCKFESFEIKDLLKIMTNSSSNKSDEEDRIMKDRYKKAMECYKWIHQLDFATSGVLLIGRHRNSTASACRAFESRATYKEYSALVYGHIIINPIWKRIEESEILFYREQAVRDREESIIISEHEIKPDTSSSQAKLRDESLSICLEILSSIEPNSDYMIEYNELKNITYERYQKDYKLRKKLRKFLKQLNRLPKDLPTSLSSSSSFKTKDQIQEKLMVTDPLSTSITDTSKSTYPFHLNWSTESNIYVYKSSLDNKDRILTMIPVAEVCDEFSCEYGHPSNPGRYAETEIEIIAYGSYHGLPVTKLKLIPKTGRRHQLRLHCLALSAPIVGDSTYANIEQYNPEDAERMMLHALHLRVPIEGWKMKKDSKMIKVEDYTIDISTADPFQDIFTSIITPHSV